MSPSDAVASEAWGEKGAAKNPQDLNRYSYGLNNPMKNVDPTGHDTWSVGLSISYSFAGFSGSYSVGVVWDNQGNIAAYKTDPDNAPVAPVPVSGVARGESASMGLTVAGTQAETIYQTQGKGLDIGISPPARAPLSVSIDYNGGLTDDGKSITYHGAAVTIGAGVGADMHGTQTKTTLHGVNLPQRIYKEANDRLRRIATPPDVAELGL